MSMFLDVPHFPLSAPLSTLNVPYSLLLTT